ncbi:MAG: flavin-containing monooxygenase [Novosphingobium sp.]
MTHDVAIIGAGFAGLYAHWKLRQQGLSLIGFEAASGVGGTWWWNRYPGARCDVESLEYCYGFSPELLEEWQWSERYATQPEILSYAEHVAARFDLTRDIRFNTRIAAMRFDDAGNFWELETEAGERFQAQFVVTAVGCLSVPNKPGIAGFDSFAGEVYFTAAWPHEGVDLSGKRVGVIGTGSSGIQSIPLIAEQAAQLTVFQRTPNFSVPAHNGPIDPAHEAEVRADYPGWCRKIRNSYAGFGLMPPIERMPATWSPGRSVLEASEEEREAAFEASWAKGGLGFAAPYVDVSKDLKANAIAADFIHRKIRSIVKDPVVADKLCPMTYPYGTKRPCVDTGYYATFNRDNVTLVDISQAPIAGIMPHGLRTTEAEYPFDVLVFATGFDGVTGPLLRLNITGLGGRRLADEWADGPRTYLGLMVSGFPNLFTVTGPSSPSVLTNMITAIEQHVDWIATCIAHLRASGCDRIDADREAEEAWNAEANALADQSFYGLANSWYMGANIPGKPRRMLAYLGGLDTYAARCEDVARDGYRGFILSAPARAA